LIFKNEPKACPGDPFEDIKVFILKRAGISPAFFYGLEVGNGVGISCRGKKKGAIFAPNPLI